MPWVDLGPPRGSLRYELWHTLRRPRLRIDADVVHTPSLAVPPVDDQPLVVTVHDLSFRRLPEVSTRQGVRFHTRGLALRAPRRDARHRSVAVHPRGARTRRLRRDRIDVVPFGVDPPVPRDPDEIDGTIARAGVTPPYVLTVGTVEPRKDVATIARAVERLRGAHPGLTLVVVGPRGWGEVRGIDRPFVQVIGAQPWSTLDALYRHASVFCLASLYEGFGLPVVEALARGTPTVATTGSALEEWVRGCGGLFSPGDVETCAEEMRRALDDAPRRLELRRAGLARAAELNWRNTAAGHARVYAAALARGAS